jgi:hypothetical protein
MIAFGSPPPEFIFGLKALSVLKNSGLSECLPVGNYVART